MYEYIDPLKHKNLAYHYCEFLGEGSYKFDKGYVHIELKNNIFSVSCTSTLEYNQPLDLEFKAVNFLSPYEIEQCYHGFTIVFHIKEKEERIEAAEFLENALRYVMDNLDKV